ncbi:MAG: YeeE/YedE family protein [Micropepsaceae bacterium]
MNANVSRIASSLAAGLVFGVGLTVSGMLNPAKIMNFLDVAGTWDPSLAFVMGAAVIVTVIGYRLSMLDPKPLFETKFFVPGATDLDARLIVGAAIFGIGWGLGGFCPGPAISALSIGAGGTYAFVAAMIAGMWAGRQMGKP